MAAAAIPTPIGVDTHARFSGMTGSSTTRWLCTRAEALAVLKAQPAGTCFYADVEVGLPYPADTERRPASGHASVKLSRPAAAKLMDGLLSAPSEAGGARLPLRVYVSGSYRGLHIG